MVYNVPEVNGRPIKSITGQIPLRRQISEEKEIDRMHWDPEAGVPMEDPKKALDRLRSRPRRSWGSKALLAMLLLVALAAGAAYSFLPEFNAAVHELLASLQIYVPEKRGHGESSPPAHAAAEEAGAAKMDEEIRLPPSTEIKQHMEQKTQRAKSEPPVVEGAEELVSIGAKATSDVRGNLADASVVTNPAVADWLADRWQAAKDMDGTPIEGEHWIEVDLELAAIPTKFVIDWEDAHSDDYSIEGRLSRTDEWTTITTSESTGDRQESEKHKVDTVDVPEEWGQRAGVSRVPDLNCEAPASAVRFVRLVIHKPATHFGTSLWRFETFGKKIRACQNGRR